MAIEKLKVYGLVPLSEERKKRLLEQVPILPPDHSKIPPDFSKLKSK